MAVTSLGLKKKLPVSLRNEFWSALMDSVEDEILLMREDIEKKKVIFTPSVSDLDRLKELGSLVYQVDYDFLSVLERNLIDLYGIPRDVATEFLRAELLKVPFQVKNKSLFQVYKSFFNFLNFSLENRISVYQTSAYTDVFTSAPLIIRDLVPDILSGIETSFENYDFVDDLDVTLDDDARIVGFNEPYSSFYLQDVTGNFLGSINVPPTLDSTLDYVLDDLSLPVMDLSPMELKFPTKHISFEMVADQVFNRKNQGGVFQDYLFTTDIAAMLYSGIYTYRKAVEVPHIGMQITFFIDKSGYSSFLSASLDTLQAKAVLNPAVLAEGVEGINKISFIQFGMGRQEVQEYTDGMTSYPTALADPIFSRIPNQEERYASDKYMGAVGEYIGQAYGGFYVESLEFNPLHTTLDVEVFSPPHLPVKPHTLKLMIINTEQWEINKEEAYANAVRITDNGFGQLVSDSCDGTINYATGIIQLSLDYEKLFHEYFSEKINSFSKIYAHHATPGTFQITLRIKDAEGAISFHKVNDNGAGVLVSDFDKFVSGSITSGASSQVDITFSEEVDLVDSEVRFTYPFNAFEMTNPITTDHKLFLYEAYIDQLVQITEAGLFVQTTANPSEDQLLAYMTFPAAEFNLSNFHMNLGVIFER